jgi:hypothetical protein
MKAWVLLQQQMLNVLHFVVMTSLSTCLHLLCVSTIIADDLRGVMGVGCSDVLAVRLWLDQKLALRSASNVAAGFDEGVGGTFFQLDKLQVSVIMLCYVTSLHNVSCFMWLDQKLPLRSASNVAAGFDEGVGGHLLPTR